MAIVLSAMTAQAAEHTTGVIVVGDAAVRNTLTDQLDAWLTGRGHHTSRTPLDADGVATLTNCLLLQDLACARTVVEKRAATDDVVYALVEKTKTEHTITITAYWIVKGHEAVSERRACESCNADAMGGTVDAILSTLSRSSSADEGRIQLDSKPSGMTVVVDGVVVGVTPVERDFPEGRHTIVLLKGTREVGKRAITLHAGETAELVMPVRLDEPVAAHGVAPAPRSHGRAAAKIALGLGAAGLVAGGVLYLTSQKDDGTRLYYRDTRPLGLGVAAGGAAIAAVGLILWLRGGPADSTPVASLSSKEGFIGWARAF